MNSAPCSDWDPKSETVRKDQLARYDQMRHHCPVAYSDYLQWSLFRHEDVMRALNDPRIFSNAVSSHLSVPNGMDPPEHTAYRRIIEPYFNSRRMSTFEPVCRDIAVDLIAHLSNGGRTDFITEFADVFAVQGQCAFMDWPADLQKPLLRWIRKNHAATLAGERASMADVALEFDGYIMDLLNSHRKADPDGRDDVTTRLLREQIGGRLLTDEEIVSVLRNWTVGELATISACVGILAHYLAGQSPIQQRLREQPSLLPPAIDEILRIHAPLISNRRIATNAVKIGGRHVQAGERITLIWASANRDEAVFGDPDEFRLDRDPAQNLLYGAGAHVCPGAPLARLELRVVMEELLKRTSEIEMISGKEPVKAVYPGSGFSSLPLRIRF